MSVVTIPSPKLKHCPFCGQPGVYRQTPDRADWQIARLWWAAGCEFGHATSPDMDTKEQAAEWWNKRSSARKIAP